MKKLSLSLFIGLLLSAQLSHAIITEVIRLSNGTQEVNLLGDYHLDLPDCHVTFKQHVDIAEREELAFRIVEDFSDDTVHPNPRARDIIKNYFSNTHPGLKNIKIIEWGADYQMFLRDPADRYGYKGFIYHYKQSIATAPMLRLHTLKNTHNVEWQYGMLVNEKQFESDRHAIIEAIKKYDDGPVLNAHYQSIINGSSHTLLLDGQILHTLYQNPDKQIVDIVAGRVHINRILPVLEKLGYKKIIEMTPPPDIRNHLSNGADYFIIPAINIKEALAQPLNPIRAKL